MIPRNLQWRSTLGAEHDAAALGAARVEYEERVQALQRISESAPDFDDVELVPPEVHPLAQRNADSGVEHARLVLDALVIEIRKDVRRTLQHDARFTVDDLQRAMQRILEVYAFAFPTRGYAQGFNQLLGVVVAALLEDYEVHARGAFADAGISAELVALACDARYLEADAFQLLSLILPHVALYYQANSARALTDDIDAQPLAQVFQRHTAHLRQLDHELHIHLLAADVCPALYLLRWVRVIFSHDLPLASCLHVWDALFAWSDECGSVSNAIEFLAVALIVCARFELLAASGFSVLGVLSSLTDSAATIHTPSFVALARRIRDALLHGNMLLEYPSAAAPSQHHQRLPHARLVVRAKRNDAERSLLRNCELEFEVIEIAAPIRKAYSSSALSAMAQQSSPLASPKRGHTHAVAASLPRVPSLHDLQAAASQLVVSSQLVLSPTKAATAAAAAAAPPIAVHLSNFSIPCARPLTNSRRSVSTPSFTALLAATDAVAAPSSDVFCERPLRTANVFDDSIEECVLSQGCSVAANSVSSVSAATRPPVRLRVSPLPVAIRPEDDDDHIENQDELGDSDDQDWSDLTTGFALRVRGHVLLQTAHVDGGALQRYVKLKDGCFQLFASSKAASPIASLQLSHYVVHLVSSSMPAAAPSPYCFELHPRARTGGARLACFVRTKADLMRWVGSLQLVASTPLRQLPTVFPPPLPPLSPPPPSSLSSSHVERLVQALADLL